MSAKVAKISIQIASSGKTKRGAPAARRLVALDALRGLQFLR